MDIIVNGRAQTVPDGATLLELLRTLNLEGRRIAVERNGDIVPRSDYAQTALASADRLEIVNAIGGG